MKYTLTFVIGCCALPSFSNRSRISATAGSTVGTTFWNLV